MNLLSLQNRITVSQARCSVRRGHRRTHTMSFDAKSRGIVTIGSVNVDSFIRINRLPSEGETLSASNLTLRPGGKGANQAACLGILSLCRSTFIGQLGDDHQVLLRGALQDCGVDVTFLECVPGTSTGNAFILSLPSGENSIMIVGGANLAWDSPSPKALDAMRGNAILLLQREVPEHVNIIAAEAADAAGMIVILDCGGEESPLSERLLSRVHVLSPNETELERLTEYLGQGANTVARAQSLISDRNARCVLVKCGPRGALFVNRDGSFIEQPAFPLSPHDIVDTTGAGDCFTAAFSAALFKCGQHLENERAVRACMTFACAAAAVCVQRPGAMPSMPTLDETVRVLEAWGKKDSCNIIIS